MAERSEVNFLPRVIFTFLGVTRILRVISELLPTHHLQSPLPFTLFFLFSKHATQIVSTKVNKLPHQLRLLMTYRSGPKFLHFYLSPFPPGTKNLNVHPTRLHFWNVVLIQDVHYLFCAPCFNRIMFGINCNHHNNFRFNFLQM